MTTPAASPATPARQRRRVWRWVAIALLALLLLLGIVAGWLLGSPSGLRFALARAQGATDGALQVGVAQGRLIGPLDLSDVRYDDGKGTVATIAKAHLDIRFWPLLRKRLHVLALDVDGVDVALPKNSPDEPESTGGFSVEPPLDIVLDRVHVGSVTLSQDGQPLFASNRLDLAGSWTAKGIELKQLALQTPEGHAELDGRLAIGKNYQGQGRADFAWKLDQTSYAGTLDATSDGKQAQLELSLSQPMLMQLKLQLDQTGNTTWTAALNAPRFDPKPLLGDSALTALGLDLRANGDRLGGTLEGKLDLNDYQVLLQPLRAQLSDDFTTLTLQQLALGSPQIKGKLAATGVVQLDTNPVSAELDIRWDDLQLPEDLAGQLLDSHGHLKAAGSTEQYKATGEVVIGPPGKPSTLTLDLDGTPERIALHSLALKQPQGGLEANGNLTLQPTMAWQLEATADKLDPGLLIAGWSGALDADIATQGSLPQDGPDATLDLRKLSGKLRERAINGEGQLHLSSNEVVDGKLTLASGASTIRIDAKPGTSNHAELTLAIGSLGDWLPDAGGRLDGQFTVRGKLPALSVDGRLQGQAVAYQQYRFDALTLTAGIPDISKPSGKLDLGTRGVNLEGMAFQHINLLAEGSQGEHRLTLDALGTQLSAQLALHGALKGQAWNGTLSTLDLEPQGIPRWRLQQPVAMSYNDGAFNLSELCLTAGDPQLCATARQDKAGNLDASYRLQALPLALLLNASGNAELPMRADGTLEGRGQIQRSSAGALTGTASITSTRGTITYIEQADQPLLGWRDLALEANLSPAQQQASLRASLDDGGKLDGQVTVSGAQQALSGQLLMQLNSLAALELLTAELAEVKGDLNGSFQFGGTLQQPAITGQAVVNGFAAEVPSAGLKLSEGRLTVSTPDAQQLRIDGTVKSGGGTLDIAGTAGIAGDTPTAISIKGNAFTAADIPAAKVVVSPDLRVRQDAKGLFVDGDVTIDSAHVNVEKLPGAGATQSSPDVVVIDQEQQQQADGKLPITAQVKVDLGEKTHLIGMGLDGRLTGVLTVSERPGRATTGQGQIGVDGTYRAYGQNLQIQRGQLLFASTPIDNPGLNIRAVRKLTPNATIDEGQEVGLMVSGKAQRPVLTVFSNPVMEQSDALSYLVTGKPLSQVKGGEGDMVGAAAQALGSAAGDLLAKSVGSKIGLDDIGVSSNEALGGSSAFTVGKFLSPRLYLSYGVGLFEPGQVITLRYRLSQRWNFEAQNATDFSRAALNYRIEK